MQRQSIRLGRARTARLAVLAAVVMQAACHGSSNASGTARPDPDDVGGTPARAARANPRVDDDPHADAGLRLSVEEIAKLGITSAPAQATVYVAETEGFGSVVGREVIAQALTDSITADAALRQSRAALARMQRLAGTAGADSTAARETAERQTVTDAAALQLARARSASILGQHSPWSGAGGAALFQSVAAGRVKVIRVSFPLGSLTTGPPRALRVSRLDAAAGDASWRIGSIWSAPADATLPGRSYLAALEGSDLDEGERLLAWATDRAALASSAGVLVPTTALIFSDAAAWCYTRRPNGAFERVKIDLRRPQAGGYFVAAGIEPGAPIVIAGAGLLLAREMGAGSAGEP